ncbi:unnamed protein product [Hermetia illucens]|uniref:NADH dehydrogenase [ubiquinone] 1 alpha subcomplex subunit 13 n=1 Tax=Hermetia illucens TaxID=343691 RepID=A0A7R8UU04_HERIL|nr:NADH dehydrogenase [ubiquinone] 1 alpha subcomplex subunit 13 [Hermetia illucens]CAD7086973.1 unnamed protein product [Hermetia illucens]
MSSTSTFRQDMPPEGGYKKIPYARVPARQYFSGYQMIAGFAGITAFGFVMYYQSMKWVRRNEIEQRSARNAILPLLLAERDREYLKQLRRNRDEEEKLMANVKGWKVGTWYGEPIYKTIPEDTLLEPNFKEFYAHSDYKSLAKRANFTLWT